MDLDEILTIQISLLDLNCIKCTTAHTYDAESNTFLKIPTCVVSDSSGNAIQERTLPVEEIVVDDTSPNLLEFDFDLNTGIITFKFDESVDSSTLAFSLITLHRAEIGISSDIILTSQAQNVSSYVE